MEFMDVVRKRRSIRKYAPQKVPDEKLAIMLEAVRLAPSGSNRQSWKFIIVRNDETKARLAEACNKQLWVKGAHAVVVCCWLPMQGIDEMRLKRDVTIATEHLILAAVNEGLGACWVGAFDEQSVKSILGIPPDVGINVLVPIGYSADQPKPRLVKKLEEIVCYESFQ